MSSPAAVAEGDYVMVAGVMDTVSGERVIDASNGEVRAIPYSGREAMDLVRGMFGEPVNDLS